MIIMIRTRGIHYIQIGEDYDAIDVDFDKGPRWFTSGDHNIENGIGPVNDGVSTRSQVSDFVNCLSYLLSNEPKKVKEASKDEFWIYIME